MAITASIGSPLLSERSTMRHAAACGEQPILRVPLEGNRDALGAIAVQPELSDELADVQFRAPVDEGHLRLTDHDGTNRHQVAKRKLMMSPSWTTYSLPSSRTSP